jgi:hypothetical protein
MTLGAGMWLLWQRRSSPLSMWWALLAVASCGNIALWFALYRLLPLTSLGNSANVQPMLFLCAAYVFGCAFRSFLPRADVQRICLFDTWLSSVLIGRSVATVAEVSFAAQWAFVLHQLGEAAGVDIIANFAWGVVPLILAAQCCSWYGVLTTNHLAHAIENSIWALAFFSVAIGLCRLLPEFSGVVGLGLVIAIIGIAAYLAFLIAIDVPMYLNRWRDGLEDGGKALGPLEGLRDASTRWTVTHDFAQWKDEIAWMSLYFTVAVWASLALCLFYSFGDHLPRYRTQPAARASSLSAQEYGALTSGGANRGLMGAKQVSSPSAKRG